MCVCVCVYVCICFGKTKITGILKSCLNPITANFTIPKNGWAQLSKAHESQNLFNNFNIHSSLKYGPMFTNKKKTFVFNSNILPCRSFQKKHALIKGEKKYKHTTPQTDKHLHKNIYLSRM